MPSPVEVLVFAEIGFFQIVWQRVGKLDLQLLQRRFVIILPVDPVERPERHGNAVSTKVICQGRKVNIVARGVAL